MIRRRLPGWVHKEADEIEDDLTEAELDALIEERLVEARKLPWWNDPKANDDGTT